MHRVAQALGQRYGAGVEQKKRKLVELDGRRRLSLAQFARSTYYFLEVQDDGVIVLTPAQVVTLAGEGK